MSNSLERANNGNKAENIILKENIRGTNGRGTSAFDDAANQYNKYTFRLTEKAYLSMLRNAA